jgi:hypothetical protein
MLGLLSKAHSKKPAKKTRKHARLFLPCLTSIAGSSDNHGNCSGTRVGFSN